MLPHTDLEDAKNMAVRIREDLKERRTLKEDSGTSTLTSSISAPKYRHDSGDRDSVVKRSDKAFYRAK